MFDHVHGKRRRNRRETLRAAGLSALVHVLIVAALVWGIQREVMAGDPAGDGPALVFPDPGGGGGGGGAEGEMVSYVNLPPPPPVPEEKPVEVKEDELIPPEETPPPEPTPTPPAQPQEAQPRPPAPAPAGAQQGAGGGQDQGQGPGTGPGIGPGSGGGSGGGTGGGEGSGTGPGSGGGGSRIRPPTTDFLLIPPEKPRGVRSQELTVRVLVDERGRVKSARLLTSTGNRGYDEQIRRWALQLGFRPAVNIDTNRPVEYLYDLAIAV
ncbi:MAG TPA: energy transducer TonB [Longimicrobium sp.]|nr:energy transducer TonB [Longimicrobium sp.]